MEQAEDADAYLLKNSATPVKEFDVDSLKELLAPLVMRLVQVSV